MSKFRYSSLAAIVVFIIGCGSSGPTVQTPDDELRALYEKDAKAAEAAMENKAELEKIPTG